MKKIIGGLLFSIATLALSAHAETTYQVEIIVFARDSADGEAALRSVNALRYPARTIALAAEGGSAPFQLLPASSLQLNREASAIEQRKSMHVLLHQAWLWPSEDAAHATAVALSAGRQFGNHHELEGYLALSAEHFLRVDTQLWLSRFSADASATDDIPALPVSPVANSIDNSSAHNTANASNTNNYSVDQLYVLREQRRMRSGELHYFDHARLGLLVLVTPLAANP